MAIPEQWRTGDRKGSDSRHVIYRVVDPHNPVKDQPIGTMNSPELARQVVGAMNLAHQMAAATRTEPESETP